MSLRHPAVATAVGLTALLVWSYWGTLLTAAERWEADPQYSHGYLVPVFAAALLWLRRDKLRPGRLRPSVWGLLFLAAGLSVHHLATHYYVSWFEQLSLLPALFGIVVLAGGWEALRWSWPAVAFLGFMMPLPYGLETALREPLREIATVTGTFGLQTVGLSAYRKGHVIVAEGTSIGVAEACSGLRMLMVFVALSTAVALLSHRPLWQRFLIAFSAVPIAIAVNTVRIVSTGILYALQYHELADLVFHDVAGWLMMPMALGLLWAEGYCLDRLFVEETVAPLAPERRSKPAAKGGSAGIPMTPAGGPPGNETRPAGSLLSR